LVVYIFWTEDSKLRQDRNNEAIAEPRIPQQQERPVLDNVTLICTLFNEAETIRDWCASLLAMSVAPTELVIVDAMSTDGTGQIITDSLAGSDVALRIIRQPCNISEGRNIATRAANTEKVAVCDAGVRFDRMWLERIAQGMDNAEWVGGYYKLGGTLSIQKAFRNLFEIPVQKVDAANFYPSSRSFAYRKSAWALVGGYDESLKIAEDTDFVKRLRASGASYIFVPDAIVCWDVRNTVKATWLQHYRYAFWDAIAGQAAWRTKHGLFYLVMFAQLLVALLIGSPLLMAMAIAIIWIKPTLNIRRLGLVRPAGPIEVFIYYMVGAASTIGYANGLFKK
jgi:glycosyltransferase involved in cell wall biosynthesis